MLKHILVATDRSETSMRAVDHALALGRAHGDKITILTATPMWSALEMPQHDRLENLHPIEEYEAARARAAGVMCTELTLQHVRNTEPSRAILDTAAMQGCDPIVRGSHGRGPIGQLLLGSVTQGGGLAGTRLPLQIVRRERMRGVRPPAEGG